MTGSAFQPNRSSSPARIAPPEAAGPREAGPTVIVMKIGILFVCSGNTCRSPMAAGAMRSLVRSAGLEQAFAIDSAGIAVRQAGEPPSPLALEATARRGHDIAAHRARILVADDLARAAHPLAMAGTHLAAMRALAPPGCRRPAAAVPGSRRRRSLGRHRPGLRPRPRSHRGEVCRPSGATAPHAIGAGVSRLERAASDPMLLCRASVIDICHRPPSLQV